MNQPSDFPEGFERDMVVLLTAVGSTRMLKARLIAWHVTGVVFRGDSGMVEFYPWDRIAGIARNARDGEFPDDTE